MEQKRKKRRTGFFRSKGFRFVILPFIAAALIFGVIAFIKSTMNAGKLTDFSRMTEDNCIYNGSGMFCYSGGYLKYYDLKNRKNDYESFIGIDENGLNFACGSEIELIYTGGSIYFVGSKRIVDVSEGIVKECKCGRNYAAVLIEGADGVSRTEMYNASGEKISTSVFASTVLTNFGFENESSSAFYTAELSTAGKDAAITITTYDLSKNSKNGVISVYGMLVDDVIFTEKSIFVVGTKHLIRYDRKTNKEVYRVLIYGYECQSVSENKKGKQVFYSYYTDEEVKKDPSLQNTGLFFFRGKRNAPYAIVVPGGYKYRTILHEGFPIAIPISRRGYNVFVLSYRNSFFYHYTLLQRKDMDQAINDR